MRISDWSSDVCSSDLKLHCRVIDILMHRWMCREVTHCSSDRVLQDCGSFLGKANHQGQNHRIIHRHTMEIGRASCRERVCQYVSITVVAVSLTTKYIHKSITHLEYNKRTITKT